MTRSRPASLASQGLVDDRSDGVARLGRRDGALGAGELDGRLEHLPLGVGGRLHAPVLHQVADDRRVAVIAEPAGVDRRRDEVVAERVHRQQRCHPGGVAEVVVEAALGQGRARRRLDGEQSHARRARTAGRCPPRFDPPPQQPMTMSGASSPASRSCSLGLETDDGLVQEDVVEDRAEGVVAVLPPGGVPDGVADRRAERAGMVGLVDRRRLRPAAPQVSIITRR